MRTDRTLIEKKMEFYGTCINLTFAYFIFRFFLYLTVISVHRNRIKQTKGLNGTLASIRVGAASQCYEIKLLKCSLVLLKSHINTTMNENGLLLPTKCLEGYWKLKYSLLSFNHFRFFRLSISKNNVCGFINKFFVLIWDLNSISSNFNCIHISQ